MIATLKRLSPRMELELLREVGRLSTKLAGFVKDNKLTGDPLHVRTGRLRRSIHSEVNSSVTEVTGIVGTNVEYAAAHEYGFKGQVDVRRYLRTTPQMGMAASKPNPEQLTRLHWRDIASVVAGGNVRQRRRKWIGRPGS